MNSNRNVWIFCITHDATNSVNSSIFSLEHQLVPVHYPEYGYVPSPCDLYFNEVGDGRVGFKI